jgi:hypothetical protein
LGSILLQHLVSG